MNIQLKKLELTNYRNIEHAVYEFDGNSKIVGDNRIGKTNTLEAIYFLLTGVLLNGSTDIQAIKPLANTRAVVTVSGTFDVDGKIITLEKRYGEDWVKQRNTGEEVLKGHFCELFYNGVKQSTTRDYNNLFNSDFGVNQSELVKVSFAQLLTNPFYFGDLCDGDEWKEARKLIIELVGDVSDDDVFAKEPMTITLKPELELAGGRIDQVKKKIEGEIKGLKETLIADDGKIDVLSKITSPSENEVSGARANINDIDEKIASLRSSKGNSEVEISLKNQIADLNMKITQAKQKVEQPNATDDVIHLGIKRNEIQDEKTKIQSKISDLNYKANYKKKEIDRLSDEKAELLLEYRTLKTAKVEVETVCPTCKRPLDPSQVEKARNEIIENNKTRMELIVLDGKKKADEIESEKDNLKSINEEIEQYELQLDVVAKRLNAVNDEIEKIRKQNYAPVKSEEAERLTVEKEALEKELIDVQTNSEKARAQINQQIYELELSKADFQKVLDDYAFAQRQRAEKERCQEEKTSHSKALVQKEQLKDMIQKFTFTKLKLLDANVSSVFGNIKFQLIKENLNGGFDTVCKPYIYDPIKKESTSVLWRSGSKSERVATGIAIAEAIKNKLDLSNMPYLFDEGGELSEDTIKTRLQTESQIICVKVQDNITNPMVISL